MVQEQERRNFNSYPDICVFEGGTLIPQDYRDAEADEVNKDKPMRKSFSTTTLKSSPGVGSWRRDSLLASTTFLSSILSRSPRKNAHLRYPTLARGLGHCVCRQCSHQDCLPSIEGPKRCRKPAYVLWSVQPFRSVVSSSLIHFAGGYNNTGTRVPFPLSNGFVLFLTGHPTWTG
jgi:hypothetical protein